MSTIDRVGLCSVKGCPAASGPDWHRPFCGHGLEGQHQHWPKRSQGGTEIVAFLCPACHMEVDNGTKLKNEVIERNGRRFYRLWEPDNDHHIESWALIWREITDAHHLSDEASALRGLDVDVVPEASRGRALAEGPDDAGSLRPDGTAFSELTLSGPDSAGGKATVDAPLSLVVRTEPGPVQTWRDAWRQRGQQLAAQGHTLRRLTDTWRWEVGDWLIQGEDVLGEEFYGECEALLGVQVEAIWDYLRVARAFPPVNRVDLPWSTHRVLAPQRYSAEERAKGLALAQQREFTTAELSAHLRAHVLPYHGCEHGHDWRCARCGVRQ